MKYQGTNPSSECPAFVTFVASFDDLSGLYLPSAHTVLLIAAQQIGDVLRG